VTESVVFIGIVKKNWKNPEQGLNLIKNGIASNNQCDKRDKYSCFFETTLKTET